MEIDILLNNIKSRLDSIGVSYTKAGKDSGAGVEFIRNMERKGTAPSIERVEMMATYLGCTVSDLLGEKKEPGTNYSAGQVLKLEAALRDIGLDVDNLSEADIAKIAKLAKTLLEE